jgi:arsenate reductase
MAEALARHFLRDVVEASSAGLAPLGHIPSQTLETLNEAAISTEGLYSKGLDEVPLAGIDCLVNLTEIEVEPFIPHSFLGKLISCPVRDPFGQGVESFREARKEIEKLVRQKLPELLGVNHTPQ